ncbi:MAG: histidine phosphotransferase family protein [Parvularculaceae bacterium]
MTLPNDPPRPASLGAVAIDAALDPIRLSALLSSRLCHDLVNPLAALTTGLEMYADPDEDAETREEAFELVETNARKAVDVLKFARLAYGQSGGLDMDVPLDEARAALEGLFAWFKADLDWRLGSGYAPKERVKALLVLAQAAADCAPRGGVVAVSQDAEGYVVEASGERVYLNESLSRALGGETDALEPKESPLLIAGLAARKAGGAASARRDEGRVTLRLDFSQSDDDLSAAALTAS